MAETTFDPSGFFAFDLAEGAVRARGGERVLILSETVLAPLMSAAVRNQDLTAVRRLGRLLGEQAAAAIDGPPRDASAEEVFGVVGAMLAVFGWGRLEVERWGPALLARLAHLPTLDDHHLGVAALLGGLLSALTERETACVPVDREGGFLIVDPSIAERVWKWSRSGVGIAGLVDRLEEAA